MSSGADEGTKTKLAVACRQLPPLLGYSVLGAEPRAWGMVGSYSAPYAPPWTLMKGLSIKSLKRAVFPQPTFI